MNLKQFLIKYDVEIHFQPIISTVNQTTMGFEALTRATHKGMAISPLKLFEEAKEYNITFSFDKHVRSLAIRKFVKYYQQNPNLLLFLNFESSLIDKDIKFQEFDFYNICQEEGISPSNLVLEIREDKITKTHLLEKFCQYYRGVGFNIALDDFGIGSSTFDRLSIVKPDIVKIDRSIIMDINKNFINNEILKAITKMCYKIGAVVLAEGVETKEEILKCKKNDISIYQGFYFAKPSCCVEKTENETDEKIGGIIKAHSKKLQEHKRQKEKILSESIDYANYVIDAISKFDIKQFDNKSLKSFMESEINLEALYLIDFESAKQVGETILSSTSRKFYSPAKHGDCHYLKDYYHITKNSQKQSYLSQKYISKATGNICRTLAKTFTHLNKSYILCLDMKH